jgi:prepilin-type N-terminal cleavage/methylation domain-containing protein
MGAEPRSISHRHATERTPRSARRSGGYTLIEMLLVAVILGVLAAMAIPGFQTYSAKARRSEALIALKAIHTLQETFYADNLEYAGTFDDLGFEIVGGSAQADGSVIGDYYTYVLQTWDVDGETNANYRATATGDIDPRDAVLDILVIENRLTVVQ